MATSKRGRSLFCDYDSGSDDENDEAFVRPLESDLNKPMPNPTRPPTKRQRISSPPAAISVSPIGTLVAQQTDRDILSFLSDELLLRILSFLPLQHLLALFPVSRRFYHLAGDSQIWKALYYSRFVLPRAMRIPGFRDNAAGAGSGHKLHYSGRRTLWADGRRGGLVREEERKRKRHTHGTEVRRANTPGEEDLEEGTAAAPARPESGVNWKRQYKLRYNWSRGKCAVEELMIGGGETSNNLLADEEEKKVLAKVVEGFAVTADKVAGLRAWDLKSRQLLVQIDLGDNAAPSCIALDDVKFDQGILDVAIGFVDGGFGVWRLLTNEKRFLRRYRHENSTNGGLTAIAFSYPYLLTATPSVLISLYTFEIPSDTGLGEGTLAAGNSEAKQDDGTHDETVSEKTVALDSGDVTVGSATLSAPYLLTSLSSYTSRPPLALSIRKTATTTIASIAYTFSSLQGWSIGIQDLHIKPSSTKTKSAPEVTTTRIAHTTPVDAGRPFRAPSTPPATPRRRTGLGLLEPTSPLTPLARWSHAEHGPINLCYTHPYLLATLPDNTLVLHMCTSNASSLSISPGIRLWGHTSGISDAEITARGKAVSVSSRGEEMRVWELEGRSNGMASRSVEIRPGSPVSSNESRTSADVSVVQRFALNDTTTAAPYDWDERRNWVGFDDEMVIVLKESRGDQGRESLMVYDFT
ncbi:hypothetical protein B0H63DRAFT_289863 [Podospora didyma]|uniref:F-box domain-containing protein n=1 Tax=Podospora didyma TaxID=330526 RepID=A0AAE0N675_9PEZI|nr:hypothetical protein B0H63DRAFT_289863 [Podospora didyma]